MRFNAQDGEGMAPCKSLAMLTDVTRLLEVTVFEPYPIPETTLCLRPPLTLDELHFDPLELTLVDTPIGPVITESDFNLEHSMNTSLRGAHAPQLGLQSVIAQTVAHLLKECGIPVTLDCDSTTLAVLEHWEVNGAPLGPLTSPILSADATVPTDSFPWQDRVDRVSLDKRPPTSDPTMADQLSDPDCRIIINILQGNVRSPHHERVRTSDKYELLEDALYRRTFKDGEPSRAVVVPRRVRPAILSRHHFSLADGGGHTGGETMYKQLRAHYWWAGMERECHAFVALFVCLPMLTKTSAVS